MPSPLSEYGYISAKLKARISTFLSEETLEKAAQAKSLQEAFLLLRGTYLEIAESRYAATGDLKAVEADLASLEFDAYSFSINQVPEPASSFIRAKARGAELDLVKGALRLWFDAHARGRVIDDRTGYLYKGRSLGSIDLGDLVNAPTPADVAAILAGSPYALIVSEFLTQAVTTGSVFEMESSLDREYFENLFQSLEQLPLRDRKVAERFVGIDVDIHNIINLIRLRSFNKIASDRTGRYLIDFGTAIPTSALSQAYESDDLSGLAAAVLGVRGNAMEAGWDSRDSKARLSSLEHMLRRIRVAEARKCLAGHPFSIGIVLAYLSLLSEQLRNVRTIVNAKYFGLANERLRSFL
ncbi:MAG: V-type ATPase subunit [Spirochaetia bacterium]|jgi:V/A-type H+-transporting ATPase subunit C|nr:V-type ATPase subunit [Spirochaetales bacterium]MDX9784518.1 V-type ATPase subunit [Spirochaetia bacterium]